MKEQGPFKDRIPDFKDVRHPDPSAPPRKPKKEEIDEAWNQIVEAGKNQKKRIVDY